MTDLPVPFIWADIPAHVSYTLIALSYWMTNIYWLRVVAVVGLTLEISYFALAGGQMHTGIGWNVVFILINAYQIYRLAEERWRLQALDGAGLLRQGALNGLEDAQLARLVRAGAWRDYAPGDPLTHEGEPVKELVLLCAGQARVEAKGVTVARLQPGSFVGEMAFVSGHAASATVVVDAPARAFAFDMARLRELVEKDEGIAAAMHRIIGRDLALKLRGRNESAAAPAARDPAGA